MFRRAFIAALALGWLVALGLVLLRGHRLLEALFVSAVTAGPAIAASAIVAGCYAVVGTRAKPAWSPVGWLSRGAAVGAFSGGVSWPLWLTIMNGFEPGPVIESLGIMLGIGALAGSLVGVVVAAYCSASRRRALAV